MIGTWNKLSLGIGITIVSKSGISTSLLKSTFINSPLPPSRGQRVVGRCLGFVSLDQQNHKVSDLHVAGREGAAAEVWHEEQQHYVHTLK